MARAYGAHVQRLRQHALAQNLAVLHVNDAIGMRLQARIVGHYDYRGAPLLGGLMEQPDDDLAVDRIECRGGLIGKNQRRRLGQCPRYGDPLFSPPDNSAGFWCRRPPRPTDSSTAAARVRASRLPEPQ